MHQPGPCQEQAPTTPCPHPGAALCMLPAPSWGRGRGSLAARHRRAPTVGARGHPASEGGGGSEARAARTSAQRTLLRSTCLLRKCTGKKPCVWKLQKKPIFAINILCLTWMRACSLPREAGLVVLGQAGTKASPRQCWYLESWRWVWALKRQVWQYWGGLVVLGRTGGAGQDWLCWYSSPVATAGESGSHLLPSEQPAVALAPRAGFAAGTPIRTAHGRAR